MSRAQSLVPDVRRAQCLSARRGGRLVIAPGTVPLSSMDVASPAKKSVPRIGRAEAVGRFGAADGLIAVGAARERIGGPVVAVGRDEKPAGTRFGDPEQARELAQRRVPNPRPASLTEPRRRRASRPQGQHRQVHRRGCPERLERPGWCTERGFSHGFSPEGLAKAQDEPHDVSPHLDARPGCFGSRPAPDSKATAPREPVSALEDADRKRDHRRPGVFWRRSRGTR